MGSQRSLLKIIFIHLACQWRAEFCSGCGGCTACASETRSARSVAMAACPINNSMLFHISPFHRSSSAIASQPESFRLPFFSLPSPTRFFYFIDHSYIGCIASSIQQYESLRNLQNHTIRIHGSRESYCYVTALWLGPCQNVSYWI